jgi:hypothetical protein
MVSPRFAALACAVTLALAGCGQYPQIHARTGLMTRPVPLEAPPVRNVPAEPAVVRAPRGLALIAQRARARRGHGASPSTTQPAPTASKPVVVRAPQTYQEWAALFLRYIRMPVCANNVAALTSWQVAEGTRAAWNPLPTTLRVPGSTTFNGAGVQDYPTLQAGLYAIGLTLWNGWYSHRYGSCGTSIAAPTP